MTVRRIGYSEALDTIRDELVYSRARLMADADAADLAPPLQDATSQLQQVSQGQVACWDAELVAQAQVDAADYELDELVDTAAKRMLRVVDRKSPRFKRYFGSDAPAAIRRLGLASETRRVSGWVESLKSEAEPELRETGARLEKILTVAQHALEARQKAAAARADHRAREIMSLIDDLNAQRLSIYGELLLRVAKTGNDRRWPDSFFLHAPSSPRQTPADEHAPTPAPTK